MGQKVHPIGYRVGVNKTWLSNWFSEKDYAGNLAQDSIIRSYVAKSMGQAGISKIFIERYIKKVTVTIHAAKPGIIIGKKGADIEKVKSFLTKTTNCEINLNIVEVKRPETDAVLVAKSITDQLVKRISYRRAMKRAKQLAMKFGAKGIKITCSGRLGGAEIARSEWYREGRVPLHTIKADISYGTSEALTSYGIIGVKVVVYHGDIKKEGKNS